MTYFVWIAAIVRQLALGGPYPHSADTPTGSHPNEPAGFTAISDRSFDAREELGWRTRRGPAFDIISDPTAPVSPPSVGVARFPGGYAGGRGPVDTYLQLPEGEFRSIYVSSWIKLSDDFLGARSNGINKLFHIWIGGKSVVVLSLQGRNRALLVPQIRLQNVQGGGRGVSFNLQSRRGSLMDRGRWYQIEILLRANSPGMTNGEVHWWLNGQLVGEDDGVGFLRRGMDATSWERVSWNPTWGSPRDVTEGPMAIFMDQIYVSGSR